MEINKDNSIFPIQALLDKRKELLESLEGHRTVGKTIQGIWKEQRPYNVYPTAPELRIPIKYEEEIAVFDTGRDWDIDKYKEFVVGFQFIEKEELVGNGKYPPRFPIWDRIKETYNQAIATRMALNIIEQEKETGIKVYDIKSI